VSEQLQVAIVGGGIGGLTAALALRARGFKVAIFEQAVELGEIGAGISIHANAALLLQRIGLTDSIQKIGVPIAGLLLRTSAGEPIDFSASPSSGIQTYNVHRAEFRRLLSDAQPEGALHFGHRLSRASETDGRVQLTFADGATVDTDLVIGADGIHSVLQREIGLKNTSIERRHHGLQRPDPEQAVVVGKRHSRQNANVARKGPQFPVLSVSSGRLMNMVAFVPTNLESEESWTAPGALNVLAAEYAGWDDPVLETIGALDQTFRWGIYDRAALPYWSTG
jgi:salicylate hydroxylase